ncbi:MAG: 23S rRNA (adenine(2503)-C(2))-methyltransferase RlmN [Candidatus Hydrogenedentota bacterium]
MLHEMKTVLAGMRSEQIADTLDIQPFQGRQLFHWIHAKRVFDFDAMTDLSKPLRTQLAEHYVALPVVPVEVQESAGTGTKKALFALPDGECVEAVLIRDRARVTLCLSSQVGCALQCSFCATGLAGFTRNLEPGEIVGQALSLLAGEELGARTPNIVFMGMGEPFRNYEAVLDSARMLMAPAGLGIGARKITISTVGEAKQIERFAGEDMQIRLSVSLHGANDALRDKLVPLNRRYPLARLREALCHYQRVGGRQFTIEWTLLDGVNDSLDDAGELIAYVGELRPFVNLIPWNPVAGMGYQPTPHARAAAFRDALAARGIKATLRQEKGQDIEAACGQLRRTHGPAK